MKVRAYQISIIILLAAIAILAWALVSARHAGESAERLASMASTTSGAASSSTSGEASPLTSAGPGSVAGNDSVSVSDQPAGASVAIASAHVSQPSWIAVRDPDGRILGAAFVGLGDHESVSIPLLRPTVAGGKYQVLVYADNGNKQFDLHADSLVTNADGSVAGAAFSAQ